jgi:hypothetical protein
VIPVAHKIIYEDQLSGEEYYHNLYNAVDFEFGMNFGLGASIEAGDGFITGDLRYYLGLTPFNSEMTAADLGNLEGNDEIIATPSGVGFDEPTAKHMAIMLMIGYSF